MTTPPDRTTVVDDGPVTDLIVVDPVLADPVLAAALAELADPPPAPDLSASILSRVDSRRRFVKRRRRRRIQQLRYAVAAGFVALVGGAALLHRLAPESARLTALDAPVGAVAEAMQTDTIEGRERLAGVATDLADLTTALISQGPLGQTPGGGTGPALSELRFSMFGGAASNAFGPDPFAVDAFGPDAFASEGFRTGPDFQPGAFDQTLRDMLERPLAASRSPVSPLDAGPLDAGPLTIAPPALLRVDAPGVIDLDALLPSRTADDPSSTTNGTGDDTQQP